MYVCRYVCRAKAGGSPEANCNLFVWIYKMLILHCILQCFFAFPSKCSISESVNVGADKLGVCPRRKMINLHLPWMAKHVCNIFPIGIAVSLLF